MVRATGHWQDWIIFVLNTISESSAVILQLVHGIHNFQARQTASPYLEQLAEQRLSYTCQVLGPTRLMNLLQPTSSGSFGRI